MIPSLLQGPGLQLQILPSAAGHGQVRSVDGADGAGGVGCLAVGILDLMRRLPCGSRGGFSVLQYVQFSVVMLLSPLSSHLTVCGGHRGHSGCRWVTAAASTVRVSVRLVGPFCSAAY